MLFLDHLRHLFDFDERGLKSLIGTAEDFQLEFKEKSDATKPNISKEDKRNLGKALSAFANADGGLLIWGIRTRRESHEDIATELKPIANIERFEQEVRAACSTLVRPALTDLQFQTIRCADDASSGYLLMKVPQAGNKPVMSYAPDHQKYFLRTIAGTTPMDDTLVRQAILAERSSELELTLRVEHLSTSQPDRYNTHLRLGLLVSMRNISAVSAVAPYIRLSGWHPRSIDSLSGFPWRMDPDRTFNFCSPPAETLVHPSDHVAMGKLRFEVLVNLKAPRPTIDTKIMFERTRHQDWRFGGSINTKDWSATHPINDLNLTFCYGAQNCPQLTEVIDLSQSYLIGKCEDSGILG